MEPSPTAEHLERAAATRPHTREVVSRRCRTPSSRTLHRDGIGRRLQEPSSWRLTYIYRCCWQTPSAESRTQGRGLLFTYGVRRSNSIKHHSCLTTLRWAKYRWE